MIKRIIILLAVIAAPIVATANAPASAVDVFTDDVCRGKAVDSTVCKDSDIKDKDGKQKNPLFGSEGILTTIINILTSIVGIVAVIFIILAGLKFITSGSNPQDVSKAREQIIYAVLALAIAALAQAAVRFIINRI